MCVKKPNVCVPASPVSLPAPYMYRYCHAEPVYRHVHRSLTGLLGDKVALLGRLLHQPSP